MRHRKKGAVLSRTAYQRRRLLRSVAVALFTHGSVRITPTRAKAVQQIVEPIITRAKAAGRSPEDNVRVRRYTAKRLGTASVVPAVVDRAQQYTSRPGGYTRITRLADRREGDAAEMVVLEFVE